MHKAVEEIVQGRSSIASNVPVRRSRSSMTPTARALLAFLAVLFVLGGNSRTDTATILLLWPLSIAVIAMIAVANSGALFSAWINHKQLLIFACAVVASIAVQLIPLPAALPAMAPGRALFDQVLVISGTSAPWRTLTLTPGDTCQAFFATLVPLAALLASITLGRKLQVLIWSLALAILLMQCLAALVQAGAPGTLPYLHAQDEGTTPVVGLMGNRNHFAVWCACMMPLAIGMLWHSSARNWPLAARLTASFLIVAPLTAVILTTLSRSGIVAVAIAVLATPWVVGGRLRPLGSKREVRIAVGGVVVALGVVIASLSYATQRMSGLDRLALSGDRDMRFAIWPQALSDAVSYFPFGSGWGSFASVFQINEQKTIGLAYVNHAHNDWLEVVLTGGALGVGLLAWAVIIWARGTWNLLRHPYGDKETAMFARFGVFACALLGAASLVDYPLRTPTLAAIFVLALVAIRNGQTQKG